jgi:hypothetical protein
MISDRKKPGWAFWANVVLVVAVLYLASTGPVTWAYYRMGQPKSMRIACDVFYAPLNMLCRHSPGLWKIMESYDVWWLHHG